MTIQLVQQIQFAERETSAAPVIDQRATYATPVRDLVARGLRSLSIVGLKLADRIDSDSVYA